MTVKTTTNNNTVHSNCDHEEINVGYTPSKLLRLAIDVAPELKMP